MNRKRKLRAKKVKASSETALRIKQALRNPGVNEVMAVYGHWREINSVMEPYEEVMSPKQIVHSSASSVQALSTEE